MSELRSHEFDALQLLSSGPHQIGVVDDTAKMAAALTFTRLRDLGLVELNGSDGDPIWSLSSAGEAVLRRYLDR